eukprot:6151478-Amphidinium_carterae.3
MLWQGSITKPFQVAVEPAVCEAGGSKTTHQQPAPSHYWELDWCKLSLKCHHLTMSPMTTRVALRGGSPAVMPKMP